MRSRIMVLSLVLLKLEKLLHFVAIWYVVVPNSEEIDERPRPFWSYQSTRKGVGMMTWPVSKRSSVTPLFSHKLITLPRKSAAWDTYICRHCWLRNEQSHPHSSPLPVGPAFRSWKFWILAEFHNLRRTLWPVTHQGKLAGTYRNNWKYFLI